MNPHDPQQILCSLLGITPIDLAVPCQVLKVSPYERNPAAIDQAARVCFARVQAAQHLVHAEAMQWMMQVIADARNAMLNAAVALPPHGHFQQVPPVPAPPPPAPTPPQWAAQVAAPPVPPAASAPAAEPAEPTVVIHVPRRRRRSGFDLENVAGAIGGLLMCGLIVFGVGMFIKLWWVDIQRPLIKPPVVPLPVEPPPDRPTVKPGGGRPTSGDEGTKLVKPDQQDSGGQAMEVVDRQRAAALENLKQAKKLAGEGSFDEALRLAGRAKRAMPDESEGLMLMIDYVEQYTGLADAAQLALNGSSEVDLGGKWGKAQFVQQDAESITFFAKGKHERFTQAQFEGIKGVRFRVTRDFLDRAANPTNDLIIGSYQFLMRVNESGILNVPGSRDAAGRRLRKAIESGDAESAESASLMIKVLDVVKDI